MEAKKSILVGSIKNGLMEIKKGETVKIVKTTSKMVYVEKNGMIKAINKNLFN